MTAAEKNLYRNKPDHFSLTERLFNLIRDGENELTIQTLLQEGVDIDAKDAEGYTPLLLATTLCRKKFAELLINYGAKVDSSDGNKRTVLHFASRNGNEWLEIVQSLVKRVPDIDARDVLGQTPLRYAALLGNLRIVKCLAEEGADINAASDDGFTPLLLAAAMGRREVVDLLLHLGAKVDIYNTLGHNALHFAALFGCTAEIVRSLMKRVCDFNARDVHGRTALHLGSQIGHLQTVKCLVEEKVDINAKSKLGQTALLVACKGQKLNVVEYLLQANASCDIADTNGNSPLYYLIKMERPSVKLIKLFIEKTANLLPADYDAILNSPQLKVDILQDVQFCCELIANKYNNHDLPKLYKLPVAGSLPCIKRMKIRSQTEVFQTIESVVRFEIQTKSHYNLLNVHPKVLNLLCVKSVLEYYDKNMLK